MICLEYPCKIILQDAYGEKLRDYKITITYKVWEGYQDIFEYQFEKVYNKSYQSLGWWLEPGAKDLCKKVEDDWLYNRLDTYNYYHNNHEFKEFLKNKYANYASIEATQNVIDDIRFDYNDSINLIEFIITNDYFDVEDEIYL